MNLEQNLRKNLEWCDKIDAFIDQIKEGRFKEEHLDEMFKDFYRKEDFVEKYPYSTIMRRNLLSAIDSSDEIKKMVATKFGCKEDEISFRLTTKIRKKEDNKYKVILGDVDYQFCTVEDVGPLEFVGGGFYGTCSALESLNNLKFVGRHMDLRLTGIESLAKLEEVGSLNCWGSALSDFGALKRVKGSIYTDGCKSESLKNIAYVGDVLELSYTIKDLGALQYVGGKIIMQKKHEELFKDRIFKKGNEIFFKNSDIEDDIQLD